MKRLIKLIKWIFIGLSAIMIVGCSATSALTGLIGSKPEITAQAGAENTKQTLGLNSKVDQSSKSDNTFKESSVGSVDSSNAKKVNASSITADMIKADRIEIRNNEAYAWEMAAGMFVVGLMAGALAVTIYATRRKNKGA